MRHLLYFPSPILTFKVFYQFGHVVLGNTLQFSIEKWLVNVINFRHFKFSGKVIKGFIIYQGRASRCVKAIPPRTVRMEECKFNDDNFRWQWTENGQIQNVKTGLCLELNDFHATHAYTTVYLGICNYRKTLQVLYISFTLRC